MIARIGQSDRLVILKKPFDNIEVMPLANALTEKWRLSNKRNCAWRGWRKWWASGHWS
jgi:hypothetical protein